MSFGSYALGVAELALIVVSLGIGAVRLRARLLPGWSGAPARVAEIVAAVSALVVVMEVLGTFHALDRVPLVIASVAVGAAAAWRLRPVEPAESPAAPPDPNALGRTATAVALALVALVALHWSIGVERSREIGIYGGDDLWYHLPFAARFAQTGSTFTLDYFSPSYLTWFYPTTSELLHSVGMLLFGRDQLSVALNLLWMGFALLAGWALGRPFGVAPVTTAAVALVLDLPVMATTQPGFAINDTFGLAAMLAALALLANGYATERPGIQPGALALAGAAMGLAVGTKVSFLAAAAAITVVIAVWHRRPRLGPIAALWGIPLLVTGGYWYLRNLVRAQNPFPWISHIGPLHLPSPDQGLNGGPPNNVAHYLFDGGVWSDFYLPGLRAELGPLWFLLLGGALAAMVLALLRRQPPSVRMAGAAGLALLAFYIVTPTAAEGPEGHPYLFQFNLRYTVPALTIGLALIPILLRDRAPQLRWGLLAAYAALTVFATRRGADFWHSGGALLGAIAIAALVLLVVAIATGGRRWRRAVTAGIATAVCLLAVALAWPQTTHYLDHRYRSGSPAWLHRFAIDPMFRWAQGLHDQRIGVSGILQYGLYGEDLSNHVQFLGKVGSDHSFREIRDCRTWRSVVDAGDYDYVITMPRYGGNRAPQARWTEQPGVTTRVLRSEPVTVFRLDGELDPAQCAELPGAGPPTRRQ